MNSSTAIPATISQRLSTYHGAMLRQLNAQMG
jgi:hypothetical protein